MARRHQGAVERAVTVELHVAHGSRLAHLTQQVQSKPNGSCCALRLFYALPGKDQESKSAGKKVNLSLITKS